MPKKNSSNEYYFEYVGVAGRFPNLQHGSRVLFLAGSENSISIMGLGVSFVCGLSCVVSDGGPNNVLSTRSEKPAFVYLSNIVVHGLLLSLKASDSRAFGLYIPGVKVQHWKRVNNRKKKERVKED